MFCRLHLVDDPVQTLHYHLFHDLIHDAGREIAADVKVSQIDHLDIMSVLPNLRLLENAHAHGFFCLRIVFVLDRHHRVQKRAVVHYLSVEREDIVPVRHSEAHL